MKDEAPANATPLFARLLAILNFVLIIVIIYCFNTIYINFLFR